MQILENGDDYDEPRFSSGSMSCLFPVLMKNDSPRKVLSYDKLHQQPLRLSVLKLDGTFFEIEVAKSGTVGELKKAVESFFSYLPKQGPGKVLWGHVWGQFCLSHEGHKLLTDSDYISLFGIKDGDQLKFVRHSSNGYNSVKVHAEREDHDSDDEPSISGGGYRNRDEQSREKDDGHQIENLDVGSSDDDDVSRCGHRLSNMFQCWFPYMKLSSSHTTIEDNESNTKDRIRFSSNKHESRIESWKGK